LDALGFIDRRATAIDRAQGLAAFALHALDTGGDGELLAAGLLLCSRPRLHLGALACQLLPLRGQVGRLRVARRWPQQQARHQEYGVHVR
jgi:hypothetical protein